MLRSLRNLGIIGAGLAAVAFASVPASASGAGAGVVTGNVTLSPGYTTVPPAPIAPQTFGFSSVVLTGAGAANNGASVQCAGAVTANASASGGSLAGQGNLAEDVGNLSISATGACTVGSITVNCAGVYARLGIIVVVAAPCTGPGQVAAGAVVVPVSLFIPNQTPPSNVTSATFAGAWVLASV